MSFLAQVLQKYVNRHTPVEQSALGSPDEKMCTFNNT